jgi:hypothetical protein
MKRRAARVVLGMTSEVRRLTDNIYRPRTLVRRLFVSACFLILTSGLIWFNREALLRQAATQWIVSDDIEPADAVVILGGGIQTRPVAAAEDYHKGIVPKILVANPPLTEIEARGILPSPTALTFHVLTRLGVPETKIETFGIELSSTHAEADALRDWVVHNHARSIIVPIESFSSRRARWTLLRVLDGSGATVQIQAVEPPGYSRVDWWKSHEGLIGFQNEVLKYMYYRFAY